MIESLTPDQQKALKTDRNLLILAGAGTGKTKTLTERVIFLLEKEKIHPSQILILTFTNKAASEMRERIVNRVLESFVRNPQDPILKTAATQIDQLHIYTFHSFFAGIIQEFGYLEEIVHSFRILEEDFSGAQLKDKVFRECLEEWSKNYGEDLTNLFTYYTFRELREITGSILKDWVDFRSALEMFRQTGIMKENQWDWDAFHRMFVPGLNLREEDYRELSHLFDEFFITFLNEANNTKEKSPTLEKVSARLTEIYHSIASVSDFKTRVGKILEQFQQFIPGDRTYATFFTEKNKDYVIKVGSLKGSFKERIQDLNQSLQTFLRNRLGSVRIKHLLQWNAFHPEEWTGGEVYSIFHIWCRWADSVIEKYRSEKEKLGLLDFHDLEQYTMKILAGHPEVAEELKQRFKYIMIDEFQDTNLLQWQIIRSFATENGKLVKGKLAVVGDKKQAIFGFRGGEVEICDIAGDEISQSNAGMEPAGVIELRHNFRSKGALIEFFNRMGEVIFPAATEKIERFDTCYHKLQSGRAEESGENSPVVYFGLYTRDPENPGLNNSIGIGMELEASMVGHFLGHVYRSEWAQLATLLDISEDVARERWIWLHEMMKRGEKSVGILFRRKNHIHYFERELINQNLPFSLESGSTLFVQQEIRDIIHLFRILMDETDDVAFVGLARSAFWGLSDLMITFLTMISSPNQSLYEKAIRLAQVLKDVQPIIPSDKKFVTVGELFGDRIGHLKRILPQGSDEGQYLNLLFPATDWLAFEQGMKILTDLRIRSILRPLFTTIVQAIGDFRIMERLNRFPDGEQRRANVRELLQLIHEYLSRNPEGELRALLNYLSQLEEGEEISQGDLDEEAVIQVLTVHKAKGLEFPLVILPDLGVGKGKSGSELLIKGKMMLNQNGEDGTGFVFPVLAEHLKGANHHVISLFFPNISRILEDRIPHPLETYLKTKDELRNYAEERRLLYVAMTRAEKALLFVLQDPAQNKKSADEETPDLIRIPSTWSDILETIIQHKQGLLSPLDSIPHHIFRFSVIPETVHAGAEKKYAQVRWIHLPRTEDIVRISPSSFGEHYEPESEFSAGIAPEQFGSIVHYLLEHEKFLSNPEKINAVLENLFGVTNPNDLSELYRHFLFASEKLREWRKQFPQVWHEVPFHFTIKGKKIHYIRGSIDLLMFDPEKREALIVDFKTNFVSAPDKRLAAEKGYDIQLALYARAAESITTFRVQSAVLLFTYSGTLIPYTSDELARVFSERFLAMEKET